MRIGLDLLSERAGSSSGTETFLLGFLKTLREVSAGKHVFFLFVNSKSADFYQKAFPDFGQVVLPFAGRFRPLRVLSQLLFIPYHSRRLKLDVVNFLGTSGAFKVGATVVQHVKTLHHYQFIESLDPIKVIFLKLLMGVSARASNAVIANTENTRKDIFRYLNVPPEKVYVVAEAVDHSIFLPRSNDDQYEGTLRKYGVIRPYILFVSSLWPYKNVHGLIKAYAYLKNMKSLRHKLVIVGGLVAGSYPLQLQEMVTGYGINEHVRFVGHVTDRCEVRDFYVGADLFIYPSYAETFGLTILEAMACGTPVVASNRTSIPEVAGNAAILVDPDNTFEMARAIQRVLSDDQVRQTLIDRGIKRAKEFDWERTVRQTLQVYDHVSQKRTV